MLGERAPERAKEWKQKLVTLVDSGKSTVFRIGDEPDDLVEEITAKIAVEIAMEAEEEDMDDNSDRE